MRSIIRQYVTDANQPYILLGGFVLGVLFAILYCVTRKRALQVLALLATAAGCAIFGLMVWSQKVLVNRETIVSQALTLGIPTLMTIILCCFPAKKKANQSDAQRTIDAEGKSILDAETAERLRKLEQRVDSLQAQIDELKARPISAEAPAAAQPVQPAASENKLTDKLQNQVNKLVSQPLAAIGMTQPANTSMPASAVQPGVISDAAAARKDEIMRVVRAAVSRQLKSPASAQFPDDLISITGNDASGYQVEGYVDSQNSYGAMIRNDFAATVAIVNGAPVVQTSSVAAKASIQRAKEFGSNYIAITIFTLIGGAVLYFFINFIVGR